jgi:protoporphyrinogen oxidase
MKHMWSADARICIVGAGAAGLTSALALKERGYKNITIIEGEPVVGGKCHTRATGDGFLEMGANIFFPGSAVNRLVRRTGARIMEWYPISLFDYRTGRQQPFGSTERSFPPTQRVRAYGRLVAAMLRHRRALRTPGFHARVDMVELATPVRKWLEERSLEVIHEMAMPFMVGAGLGYPEDDVPVAYFFKMLQFIQAMGIRDLVRRRTYRLEHGYQDLWQRVASRLLSDVQLHVGARALRVLRPADGPIRVWTEAGEIVCDALLITATDRALSFLDASGEERDLLESFRYFDLFTVGCTVEGQLPLGLCFIRPHTRSRSTLGRTIAYCPMKVGPVSQMGRYLFYSHGSPSVGPETIVDNLRHDLSLQGCRIIGEPVIQRWPHYFPHVSSQDFAGGFFQRLDRLQGQRGTYYAGEAVSGTNVSVVADHAETQIARFFRDHGPTAKGMSHVSSR